MESVILPVWRNRFHIIGQGGICQGSISWILSGHFHNQFLLVRSNLVLTESSIFGFPRSVHICNAIHHSPRSMNRTCSLRRLESFRRLFSLNPVEAVEPPILEAFAPLPAARQAFREPICWQSEISSYRSSRFGLEYLIVMGFVTVLAVWLYRIAFQLFTVWTKEFQSYSTHYPRRPGSMRGPVG